MYITLLEFVELLTLCVQCLLQVVNFGVGILQTLEGFGTDIDCLLSAEHCVLVMLISFSGIVFSRSLSCLGGSIRISNKGLLG